MPKKCFDHVAKIDSFEFHVANWPNPLTHISVSSWSSIKIQLSKYRCTPQRRIKYVARHALRQKSEKPSILQRHTHICFFIQKYTKISFKKMRKIVDYTKEYPYDFLPKISKNFIKKSEKSSIMKRYENELEK